MSRQYDRKSTAFSQKKGLSGLWLGFVTFVFGYLAASWCDVNQLSHWVTTYRHATPPQQVTATSQVEATVAHPKLEFYTLLANESSARMMAQADAIPEKKVVNDVQVAPIAQALDLEVRPSKTPEPSTPATRVALSQATPVRDSTPVQSPAMIDAPKSPGMYSVQVGSFRALREAQRMRTQLVMKGFSVEIATVMQQDTNWYRVIIGPFGSMTQAQQAQQSFARKEHIMGMIRKLT